MATRFKSSEILGIKMARETFPALPQRALAAKIHTDYQTYSQDVGRTQASIYSALRKVDRAANWKPVSKTAKSGSKH